MFKEFKFIGVWVNLLDCHATDVARNDKGDTAPAPRCHCECNRAPRKHVFAWVMGEAIQ